MSRAAALAIALAVAACAPAAVQLPDEPLARATTCAAVRELELSAGRANGGEVSFAGFTEILHFAMLAAAEDGVQVDLRRLFTVQQRAPAAVQTLDEDWASLVEPCNSAYPETQRPAPPLPRDPYEAGLTCFGMADTVARTATRYPAEQSGYAALAERALQAAQPVLRQRARDNDDALRIAAGYTARAFKAGRPASLLDQCMRRFPAN